MSTEFSLDSLPHEQVTQLKTVFDIFDRSQCGSITMEDLGHAMRSLGHNPTDSELRDIVNEVDQDGNGSIEFEEFVQMIMIKLSRRTPTEVIRDSFRVFDKNSDGFITPQELRASLTNMQISMKEAEIDEMFAEADLDKDGLVSYEDFVFMMVNGQKFENR